MMINRISIPHMGKIAERKSNRTAIVIIGMDKSPFIIFVLSNSCKTFGFQDNINLK